MWGSRVYQRKEFMIENSGHLLHWRGGQNRGEERRKSYATRPWKEEGYAVSTKIAVEDIKKCNIMVVRKRLKTTS